MIFMYDEAFFKQTYDKYISLKIPNQYKDLANIEKLVWYLADELKGIITFDNPKQSLIEVDINSAFPTLCNILFKDNVEFITKLNSLQEKRAKNILIATTFKQTKYLRILNLLCKMLIFYIAFKIDP